MKVEIKNKKTYSGPGYYIGRPSPLGNPFEIGRDGTRDDVIAKYALWLAKELETHGAAAIAFDDLLETLELFGGWTRYVGCGD